jgi:hypothetical protein
MCASPAVLQVVLCGVLYCRWCSVLCLLYCRWCCVACLLFCRLCSACCTAGVAVYLTCFIACGALYPICHTPHTSHLTSHPLQILESFRNLTTAMQNRRHVSTFCPDMTGLLCIVFLKNANVHNNKKYVLSCPDANRNSQGLFACC